MKARAKKDAESRRPEAAEPLDRPCAKTARAKREKAPYEGDAVFIDRELSWLAFNRRVLGEAMDPAVPLLERLRFLSIVGSNLDEFFEVRVASLLQKVESGAGADGIAQIDAGAKLESILQAARDMVRDQHRIWVDLQKELRREGVAVKPAEELTPEEEAYARRYFRREIYPLLTPITVDPAHPFPWLINKALGLALLLKAPGRERSGAREILGVLSVPRTLPRVVALPSKGEGHHPFIFTSDLVRHCADEVFRGYPVKEAAAFRATRNSNLYTEEDLDDDDEGGLLEAVEEEVRNRRRGDVVRLEIEEHASAPLVDLLVRNLDLEPRLVFRTGRPVNLNRLSGLYDLLPLPRLKFPPHAPAHPKDFSAPEAIFPRLKEGDVLLHHPFESFDPVVRFIETAARDPKVLAIKTTLYRTSADSPIMYALLEAVQRGKEVVVVVELKARFDEQSNIRWARQLEERGGTVVYGLVGLKTHCKLALIVRREKGGFRRYAHIGTGNYNPDTARLYTDFSLFTREKELTGGVSEVFNYLTANTRRPDFKALWVAPISFLAGTLEAIRRETRNARAGKPSGIAAKVNALMDREVIEALYEASRAGVPVKLIVRDICSLRRGVPGLSATIRVKSVVGRFLEHSRVFCFRDGGEEAVHIGSGDWMIRNLRERVEAVAPVRDPALRARLTRALAAYWADDAGTHWMRHDGSYEKASPRPGQPARSAQEYFMREASEGVPPWDAPGLWET